MAEFNTYQIRAIYSLILGKVGLPPVPSTFKLASDRINRDCEAEVEISPRFLSERYDWMIKAVQHKDDIFRLHIEYLNKLVQFIGHSSYAEFDSVWRSYGRYFDVKGKSVSKVVLFVRKGSRSIVDEQLKMIFYPGEETGIEIQQYSDLKSLSSVAASKLEEGSIVLLFLPSQENFENIRKDLGTELIYIKNLLLFYPDEREKQDISREKQVCYLWSFNDFPLIVQYARYVRDLIEGESSNTAIIDQANRLVDQLPQRWSWSVGLGLLAAIILLILLFPCPTRIQLFVFRVALAFSVAVIISAILTQEVWKDLKFRGLISIGTLLLVYFINPAHILSLDRCGQLMLKGRVTLGDQPLQGAWVRVADHGQEVQTSNTGEFHIPLDYRIHDRSISISVENKGIDTSFVFEPGTLDEPLLIRIPDSIAVPDQQLAMSLVNAATDRHQRHIENELGVRSARSSGRTSSLQEVCSLYRPFDAIEARGFRNEYHFTGLCYTLEFRKHLIAEGITEMEPLEPYLAHHIKDHQALVLGYEYEVGNAFRLEYAFINNRPLTVGCVMDRISRTKYRLQVRYSENIRAVVVKLEKSPATDHYRKRIMHFYGFRPEEEYTISFIRGAWKLDQIFKP